MDALEIGRPQTTFGSAQRPTAPPFEYLVAALSVEGLSATKRVYAHCASGWRELADFFGVGSPATGEVGRAYAS